MASTWPHPICFEIKDESGIVAMEQKFLDQGHKPIRKRIMGTRVTVWAETTYHRAARYNNYAPVVGKSGVFGVFNLSDEVACVNAEAEAVAAGHAPLPVNVWLVDNVGLFTEREVHGPECGANCPACSDEISNQQLGIGEYTDGVLTDIGNQVAHLCNNVSDISERLDHVIGYLTGDGVKIGASMTEPVLRRSRRTP